MTDSSHDIAIIGGGLAGLTLAIQCADAGYDTTLFEKETYPFHRVCGEYISMESYAFLERCGLPLQQWQLPMINRLQVSAVNGKLYDFKLPLGGFGISRYTLDDALYKLALQKGVTVHTGCKVNDVVYQGNALLLRHSRGNTHARVVAGSFGKRSNLDIRWSRAFTTQRPGKLDNYIGIKYHVRYSQQTDTIALHNFQNGYCGISRVEDGKSCLCYLTTAENLKRCSNSIRTMERELLCRNPQLKKIFSTANFLLDEPIAISQISFSPKKQVERHVLMSGDAAGMITPLCGNGMSMAMHAGKIAFHYIRDFLSGRITRQEMEQRYEMEWKNQFGRRLQTGRTVQYFFGGNLSTRLFLKTMHAVPALGRMVIRQTHGRAF